MDIDKLDDFTRAYIECALWSSTDTDSTGKEFNLDAMGIEYLAPETIGKMIADCQKFQLENSSALKNAYSMFCEGRGYEPSSAGHDFWLTRCGHGAGFWDRGLEGNGDVLSDAAQEFGNIDLYIGDDGRIYA